MLFVLRATEATAPLAAQMKAVALRAIADTERALSGFVGGPELTDAVYSEVEKLFALPPLEGIAG